MFLYFLTFCQTFVILAVLGIPYPLILAVATAIADVLPILGPGLVLAPVAIYQLLTGHYARTLGVVIGWLVITCIRQVVEPKLVSSTVKVHPLATLAAALLTYSLRNIRLKGLPLLSTLPPVLLNAVVVGLELTVALFGFSWPVYGLCMLQVGLGQLAACTVCGLLLYAALSRTGAARAVFRH